MTKKQTEYICSNCGYVSPVWFGKCPSCNLWDVAVSYERERKKSSKTAKINKETLNSISLESKPRFLTGLNEFDRSIGGGIVPGSVTLLSGEPGIGKSTIMLQICEMIAKNGKVLYFTGEESAKQIKLRAERLNLKNQNNIDIISSFDIEPTIESIEIEDYILIVFDSLQTIKKGSLPGIPGSIIQVRETANDIVNKAKTTGVPIFIVTHVTKMGDIAGPKAVEHLVDCVLFFESGKKGYRILRTLKNRFGPSDEISVYEMSSGGLIQIEDISSIFVDEYSSAPGNVISVVNEGSRSFFVEIQSLVSKPIYGTPRKLTSGVSLDRVLLTSAVLTKRLGVPLDSMDVYVNVAGGLQIKDTATDLAIALSLLSSFSDKSIPVDFVSFGEIALDGTLRSVYGSEKRLDRINRSNKTGLYPDKKNGMHDVKDLFSFLRRIGNGS